MRIFFFSTRTYINRKLFKILSRAPGVRRTFVFKFHAVNAVLISFVSQTRELCNIIIVRTDIAHNILKIKTLGKRPDELFASIVADNTSGLLRKGNFIISHRFTYTLSILRILFSTSLFVRHSFYTFDVFTSMAYFYLYIYTRNTINFVFPTKALTSRLPDQ